MTHVREVVTPGGVKVGGFGPSARVHVPAGGVSVGGVAPSASFFVVSVVYAVAVHDGYHLAADHHDLVAYGTELALVVAFVFVSAKLVGGRLLR